MTREKFKLVSYAAVAEKAKPFEKQGRHIVLSRTEQYGTSECQEAEPMRLSLRALATAGSLCVPGPSREHRGRDTGAVGGVAPSDVLHGFLSALPKQCGSGPRQARGLDVPSVPSARRSDDRRDRRRRRRCRS